MIGQQVTLSGYAGWLKVADTGIEAGKSSFNLASTALFGVLLGARESGVSMSFSQAVISASHFRVTLLIGCTFGLLTFRSSSRTVLYDL